MRDKRFIAQHRGGSLSKEDHIRLMKWACDCVQHILHLSGDKVDPGLTDALQTANDWARGKATVGDARNASLQAIAVAREANGDTAIFIARATGHAVATAHMADHAVQAAAYAIKAVKASGKSIEEERKWQHDHVPPTVRDLIFSEEK